MSTRHMFSSAAVAMALVGTAASAHAQSADLTNLNATTSASSAMVGQAIAVDVEVHNVGTAAAGASRIKYYFSSDDQWDAGDTYLNWDAVAALGAGASAQETANVRVPAGTPDGTYRVLIVADVDGDVAETNEGNNVVALPLTVGAPSVGTDFAVEGASLSRLQADPGEVVRIDLDVRNRGTESSSLETRVKYYLSTDTNYDTTDSYLNWDRVPALAADATSPETANLRVPLGTPSGGYYVLAVADETELVAETNEGNNVVALPLVVGDHTPAVDLGVDSASLDATLARTGTSVRATAVVANLGDLGAPDAKLRYVLSTDTQWDPSDKQLSWDKVDALGAGASGVEDAHLNISAATEAGSYYVLFVVVSDDAADTHAEADDVLALPLDVTRDHPTAARADLTVAGGLDGVTVAAGKTVGVTATIANEGVAAAGASRLKYYFSDDATWDYGDTYLNYDAVASLAVGEVSAENATLTIPAVTDGPAFILLVADAVDDVPEQYESDNVIALPFTVGNAPPSGPIDQPGLDASDLVVQSAWVDDPEVPAGERAALHVIIENRGAQASPPTRVKYYLSRDAQWDANDRYASYDNVVPLSVGATSQEDVMPLVPAISDHGSWFLLAVVDANDDATEQFESNNVHAVPITVVVDDPGLDAPDLTSPPPTLSKVTAAPGRVLDLTVAVSNEGTQLAVASRLKIYLSEDGLIDGGDTYLGYQSVGALDPGETATVEAHLRVPPDAMTGLAHVLVRLDCDRANMETFESNNIVGATIDIGPEATPPPPYPYACPSYVFTNPALLARTTVATFNALKLGWNNGKDQLALACVVSHFDLVGLVEIVDPQGVDDLVAELELLTGEAWSSHVSPHAVGNANGTEYYGYVWRDLEVTMTGVLGFFDDPHDTLKREPYGANFQIGSFDFTLVVFHLRYGQSIATRRAEAEQLIDVYDDVQARNGPEQDVLIGGDFNLPGDDAAFTILEDRDVSYVTDPEQKTTISAAGLANSFDNVFYPFDETPEILDAGVLDFTQGNYAWLSDTVSDHLPVWVEVDPTFDDD
ncbi:MAG: CARDB domain-containing protein [Myxococcota bacterium]